MAGSRKVVTGGEVEVFELDTGRGVDAPEVTALAEGAMGGLIEAAADEASALKLVSR